MNNTQLVTTYDEVERAARAMAGSGFFTDTREAAQAIVKIMAGAELGVGAFASMTGVNIIQGKPAFSANLMAAAVKRSGRYNYRVTEMNDKVCSVEFLELFNGKWQASGVSTFTIDDARKAGTKNLDKFPRNMLFARAMSNGVRWYCPDVMNGAPAYTPEELGAEVDQDGDVIAVPEREEIVEGEIVEAQPARKPYTMKTGAKMLGYDDDDDEPQSPTTQKSAPKTATRPYEPVALLEALEKARDHPKMFAANDKQVTLLTRTMQKLVPDADTRHLVQSYLWGHEHAADVEDKKMLNATLRWLNLNEQYDVDDVSAAELSDLIKYVKGADADAEQAELL